MISGTLTKISDTQFTFTPDEDLELNKVYKFVIKSNFRSYTYSFINHRTKIIFTTVTE